MANAYEIITRISKLNSRLKVLEDLLISNPESISHRLTIKSTRRKISMLENEFRIFASKNQFDIIDYRLINESPDFSIENISDNLNFFQKLITSLYDSVTNGKKIIYRPNSETKSDSRLNIAYTYPGSLGIVLTANNESDLFNGKLDETVDIFESYSTISKQSDIKYLTKEFGLSATNSFYNWLSSNYKWQNEVDIGWQLSNDRKKHSYISLDVFSKIKKIIDVSSEIEEKEYFIEGTLVAIDYQKNKFKFLSDNDKIIYGDMLFDEHTKTKLPSYYKAYIKESITRFPATGKETIQYYLADIQELIK